MVVKRIVADIAVADVGPVRDFYTQIFDLDVAMDHGWVATLKSNETTQPQISIVSDGGSGADIPDMSIEVDDVEKVFQRVKSAGIAVEYDMTDEPWGVRRFFIRDPAGKLLNVLMHI